MQNSSDTSCQNCARLEAELERAREEIEELEEVLDAIMSLCREVMDRASPVLSRPSGVPRGFWSRIKGRVDVARLVLRYG